MALGLRRPLGTHPGLLAISLTPSSLFYYLKSFLYLFILLWLPSASQGAQQTSPSNSQPTGPDEPIRGPENAALLESIQATLTMLRSLQTIHTVFRYHVVSGMEVGLCTCMCPSSCTFFQHLLVTSLLRNAAHTVKAISPKLAGQCT